MKAFIVLLIGGLAFGPKNGFTQTSTQTLVISNLEKKKGKVYIGWYNSENSYMKENEAVLHRVVPVEEKEEISVDFKDVKAGTYAISVFFDENDNGKLDKNSFGIPKEEYGFSNNVRPATRAASFKEASFEVKDKAAVIPIKMK